MSTPDSAEAENVLLRQMLWLRHGCHSSALYGDDGKMDCNSCLIDFRNATAQEIQDRFWVIARHRGESLSPDDFKAIIQARRPVEPECPNCANPPHNGPCKRKPKGL